MADHSAIEWTDATWNPIRARNKKTGKLGFHCEHATTGCEFCYAEGFNKRLGTGLPFKPGHRDDIEIFLDETMLKLPLVWKKPRRIFVCSMTDLFADFMPDEFIDKMFAVMALSPQHTFQVLTKRAERMRDYFSASRSGFISDVAWEMHARHGLNLKEIQRAPLPNVWLGVSAERQAEADERIPALLQTPAAIRFISAEPLLGPLALYSLGGSKFFENPSAVVLDALTGFRSDQRQTAKLDWVIVGGESGPSARPMHPAWAQSLRDQCAVAGMPFLFKQWGEHAPVATKDNFQIDRSRFYLNGHGFPFHQIEGYALVRVGKKNAGRKLDGIEHNGFPARSST